MILDGLTGSWSGTNGFRLMPGDALAELPATASVTTAAGGHLTVVAYTWGHPDDGPQEGLLVVGTSGEGLTATWADSWHQQPDPTTLAGSRAADGAVDLETEYAPGWFWRIHVASGGGELQVDMANVVPPDQATAEAAAGPYPVMVLRARPV